MVWCFFGLLWHIVICEGVWLWLVVFVWFRIVLGRVGCLRMFVTCFWLVLSRFSSSVCIWLFEFVISTFIVFILFQDVFYVVFVICFAFSRKVLKLFYIFFAEFLAASSFVDIFSDLEIVSHCSYLLPCSSLCRLFPLVLGCCGWLRLALGCCR